MNNQKFKKIIEIGSSVLLYLFLAICIASLGLTIFAPKDKDGTAEVFGYQLRVVVSDSMAKCEDTDVSKFEIKSIPIRSMVFVETVPDDPEEAKAWYDDLEVGDVLTFKYVYSRQQVTITHRITDIDPKGDGYVITLKGDNKASESQQMEQVIDTTNEGSFNYVVGKVVGQSYLAGLVLSIMKSPIGLIFVIIVPCAIVIIMEVIKIISVLNAEKQKKADEETKKKDDELEELRKRLAMLENMAAGGQNEPTEPAEEDSETEATPTTEESTEEIEDSVREATDDSDCVDEPDEEATPEESDNESAADEPDAEPVENEGADEENTYKVMTETTEEAEAENDAADETTEDSVPDESTEVADEISSPLSDEADPVEDTSLSDCETPSNIEEENDCENKENKETD